MILTRRVSQCDCDGAFGRLLRPSGTSCARRTEILAVQFIERLDGIEGSPLDRHHHRPGCGCPKGEGSDATSVGAQASQRPRPDSVGETDRRSPLVGSPCFSVGISADDHSPDGADSLTRRPLASRVSNVLSDLALRQADGAGSWARCASVAHQYRPTWSGSTMQHDFINGRVSVLIHCCKKRASLDLDDTVWRRIQWGARIDLGPQEGHRCASGSESTSGSQVSAVGEGGTLRFDSSTQSDFASPELSCHGYACAHGGVGPCTRDVELTTEVLPHWVKRHSRSVPSTRLQWVSPELAERLEISSYNGAPQSIVASLQLGTAARAGDRGR